jgi:hypothetical protein
MTKENTETHTAFATVLAEIERVRTKIDLLGKQHIVDLSREYSKLLEILIYSTSKHLENNLETSGELRTRWNARLVRITLTKIYNVEHEACNKALSKLIERFSKYAEELEESLIDTGELRKTIYEAQRQQSTADLKGDEITAIKDCIVILDKEIEKLSAAYSGMQAKAPGEKRKISFKLVEIFIAYLACILIPYITYEIAYLHSDPFEVKSIGLFAAFYLLSCIAIYVAIGWIARVRYKGQAKTAS